MWTVIHSFIRSCDRLVTKASLHCQDSGGRSPDNVDDNNYEKFTTLSEYEIRTKHLRWGPKHEMGLSQ